jgi:hypothetical protein
MYTKRRRQERDLGWDRPQIQGWARALSWGSPAIPERIDLKTAIQFVPQVLRRPRWLEVVLDGGVRRGGDVVKALALGAQAVMIGRAYLVIPPGFTRTLGAAQAAARRRAA